MDVVTTWTGRSADALRLSLRMTQEQFAAHLGLDVRGIAKWAKYPDVVPTMSTQQLLDMTLVKAADEVKVRFAMYCDGQAGATLDDAVYLPGATEFSVTSHKFVPLFIGAEAATSLLASLASETVTDAWLPCQWSPVEHENGTCRLYIWPFGVAVFYLTEPIRLARIAELCAWRRESYARNRLWASAWLMDHGVARAEAEYVLSAYWLDASPWPEKQLETALRLLCIPRALHGDGESVDVGQAWEVEQAMLRDGFDDPDIVSFGMKGIAHGLASWSGVVYLPVAADRCLEAAELVDCELTVQAIWAYCAHLRKEVEAGHEPVVPTEYSWRYLRGVKSRLTTERPTETAQQRAMREAIVGTSGLDRHMDQAIDILRESERR